MLTWAPISSKTEIKITKPKLAINSLVNLVVCVKKPGPIAEVAMRKAAPRMALLSPKGGPLNSLIFCNFFIAYFFCLSA
jgi:hypothetical protein